MKRTIIHALGGVLLTLFLLPAHQSSAYGFDRAQLRGLDAIRWAASHWRVNYYNLRAIAWRESRYEPGAYNSSSGASGLFQFMPGTYYAYARRIGEFRSIFNPYANANVAAYMFSVGLGYAWRCC